MVSGTVTYQGKPVERGTLTFYPADRKGVARAAEVVAGRYRLESMQPGMKRVRLTVRPEAKLVEGDKKLRLVPGKDRIPAKGVENGEVVEVKGRKQTLDFDLKKRR
jgi:hypothetical protein